MWRTRSAHVVEGFRQLSGFRSAPLSLKRWSGSSFRPQCFRGFGEFQKWSRNHLAPRRGDIERHRQDETQQLQHDDHFSWSLIHASGGGGAGRKAKARFSPVPTTSTSRRPSGCGLRTKGRREADRQVLLDLGNGRPSKEMSVSLFAKAPQLLNFPTATPVLWLTHRGSPPLARGKMEAPTRSMTTSILRGRRPGVGECSLGLPAATDRKSHWRMTRQMIGPYGQGRDLVADRSAPEGPCSQQASTLGANM